MALYMAVTPDKYELPVAVEDSPTKLARKIGVSVNMILASLTPKRAGYNNRRRMGYRYRKVEVEDDAWDESRRKECK